ncbi:MAG: NAD(P)/FAD-dependent oxidoreductase [Clostridia bacterium]|nr:NAD(P)/FAD-dependent oxidoreductase [Clostridia bacterium]MEE0807820.1 NAD(P)/FAD-dependent oxidoreductase [Acutalibacteraceae bacterium]
MKNVVVIGGGAAGLMAASSAAFVIKDTKHTVTVIEKNSRPARKVMITGKGRCNVTNNCDVNTLIANTARNGKFLFSAFNGYNSQDTMAYFENLGVPLKTERGNRVFPVSDKAVDIVDALVAPVRKTCNFIEGTAECIIAPNGKATGVKLTDGRIISADAVIVATGGMSYPLTGSTGDGYRMAKALGHTVTELKPSLVGMRCHEGFCTELSGLSLKNVTLSVFEDSKKKPLYSEMGEMLFTHTGISGPLALSASAYIRYLDKKQYTAVIDLKPALSHEALDKRILRDFSEAQNCNFSNSLNKLLPRALISVIIRLSGIAPDTKVNQISREQRKILVDLIKNLTLHITGFNPIEEAIITSGGISVKEIEPATMRSKLIEGLYFAGEIIDVDALTGGFNLQIAFSTGYLAGKSAAQYCLEEEL